MSQTTSSTQEKHSDLKSQNAVSRVVFLYHCVGEIQFRPLTPHGCLQTAFALSSVGSPPHATKTCPPKLYHLFIYHTDSVLEQWHVKGCQVDLCSSISDNTRYRLSDKPALGFSGSSFYPKSSCYNFINPQHQPILKPEPIQVVLHSVAVLISHQQCRHTLHKTDENKTFKWQQTWMHRSVTHRFTFIPANHAKHAIAPTELFKDLSISFSLSVLYLENTSTDKQSP